MRPKRQGLFVLLWIKKREGYCPRPKRPPVPALSFHTKSGLGRPAPTGLAHAFWLLPGVLDLHRASTLTSEQPFDADARRSAELRYVSVGKGSAGFVLLVCALVQFQDRQHRPLGVVTGFARKLHPADEGVPFLLFRHPFGHVDILSQKPSTVIGQFGLAF